MSMRNARVYVCRIEDTSKTGGRNVFREENRHATEPSRIMTLSSLCYPLGVFSPPFQLSTDPLGPSVMVTKLLLKSSAY